MLNRYDRGFLVSMEENELTPDVTATDVPAEPVVSEPAADVTPSPAPDYTALQQQYETLSPWQEAIQTLSEFTTPEDVVALLRGTADPPAYAPPTPAPAPFVAPAPTPPAAPATLSPEEQAQQYQLWLFQRHQVPGPEYLDPTVEPLYRHLYQMEQQQVQQVAELQGRWQEFDQAQAQARQQAEHQQLQHRCVSELNGVLANEQFQRLNLPTFTTILQHAWMEGGGKVPMARIAARVNADVQAMLNADRAAYATGKAKDAAAPVVGTGGAPPHPAPQKNIFEMDEAEKKQYMDEILNRGARS